MKAKQADSAAATAPLSVWERMAQPTPAPRPGLTLGRIAEVALGIADADGLAAVSMRRLAEGLGVSAMTCYRYVTGKDEIIELMLDDVRREMLLDDLPGDWRGVLRASALRFREVVLRHPWMTDVPGRILFAPTPAYLALSEQLFAALHRLGLDLDRIADVTGAVTAYARAGTHDEITRTRLRTPEGWSSSQDARDANRERLIRLLDNGDYPVYRKFVREGAPQGDERARFEFGLDCLLDGISARPDIPAAG
ncbi:TetR/AcrR family transcriptional regulator [Streptacidiphilus pinicola]|uniref:TetR/AcrR family transcriptional regulator n=2 Tax=Streptacidiphilus pinicola TaxID=2219663 RepID=A0A2X0K4M7_9ACTN|nr:TetR/AcrR family transcriptional regulator [Streptacidiphilus pinicola]